MEWMDYLVLVVMSALFGVVGYFALWLCGMPARPIGYAGAALLSVVLLHLTFLIGKTIKRA